MQSDSAGIWTRVAVSISYDDNHYTTDDDDTLWFEHYFGVFSDNLEVVPSAWVLYLRNAIFLFFFHYRK